MDEIRSWSRGFRTIDFICKRSPMTYDMPLMLSKINTELGWKPSVTLKKDWENGNLVFRKSNWLNNITSGEYATYYEKQYGN
jgi:dTDP-D-glucose 4,6-dehydratase